MAEYEVQKAQKPVIDDLIQYYLTGKTKRVAEDFVAFLTENKLTPAWGAKNSYNTSFKNKRVCIIKINPGSLDIRVNTQYSENFNNTFEDADEEIKEFLRNSVTYCFACGTCKPGISMTLLSKEIKNACFNPVLRLENPDEKYVKLAKELVLLRKKEIQEGNTPKVTYISIKKR